MVSRTATIRLLGLFHHSVVFSRRVRVLSREVAPLLPPGRMLDVGSGSGLIATAIARLRPDVSVEGLDVMVRHDVAVHTTAFDGMTIPLPDDCAASAVLIDVLHHAVDPLRLLSECARVARTVVVKDHLTRSWIDRKTLELMDWVGNRPHGVVLPFTFFDPQAWERILAGARLVETARGSVPTLYPFPVSAIFGRDLHFISRLQRELPGR
jgi:SAM-dependent methyltransferase